MKAPDDKPETELCPFWVLYDSSGTIFELTLTTIENLLGDLAMEPSDMLLYSSIGNRDALATKRTKKHETGERLITERFGIMVVTSADNVCQSSPLLRHHLARSGFLTNTFENQPSLIVKVALMVLLIFLHC